MDDFKDRVANVDKKGKRKWIYAFQPKGGWYLKRSLLSYLYLIVFFSMPWIKIDGYPIMLLDINNGMFILFGQVFFPQDFILLGIFMLTALVLIVLFTILLGRIFCGWICPQTIFMEMVFRKIEYWIEGPAHLQKINDNKQIKPSNYYLKKVLKHIVFILFSFLIANTFLSYIIGVDELIDTITSPIENHLGGLIAIIIFTCIFYSVYAFARELVCTVVCPYGRLQSVMLDKNTLVVGYDYNRGEPRDKKRKNSNEVGDCIDCNMCVNVCPTGIDIRNGTQMECIHCTACIDACNAMMENVNLPINLIKYTSENTLNSIYVSSKWNLKNVAYSILVILLTSISIYLFINRPIIDATILKVAGQMYQSNNEENTISNLYKINVISNSKEKIALDIVPKDSNAVIKIVGNTPDSLELGKYEEFVFFITYPQDKIQDRKNIIHVDVLGNNSIIDTKEITFLGKY